MYYIYLYVIYIFIWASTRRVEPLKGKEKGGGSRATLDGWRGHTSAALGGGAGALPGDSERGRVAPSTTRRRRQRHAARRPSAGAPPAPSHSPPPGLPPPACAPPLASESDSFRRAVRRQVLPCTAQGSAAGPFADSEGWAGVTVMGQRVRRVCRLTRSRLLRGSRVVGYASESSPSRPRRRSVVGAAVAR